MLWRVSSILNSTNGLGETETWREFMYASISYNALPARVNCFQYLQVDLFRQTFKHRLRAFLPESHSHPAELIDRRGDLRFSLRHRAARRVNRADAHLTVGCERAHGEITTECPGLPVIGFGLFDLAPTLVHRSIAEQLQRARFMAALLMLQG